MQSPAIDPLHRVSNETPGGKSDRSIAQSCDRVQRLESAVRTGTESTAGAYTRVFTGILHMTSIPSRQSIWSPIAAYALIKVLGWLRRESDRPETDATRNKHRPSETVDRSGDTASRKVKSEPDHGVISYWGLFRDAVLRWINHKAARLGAALAYYSVFSIGPLMLIAIAVAGLFFGADAVRGQVSAQLSGLLGEAGAKAVETMLAGASQRKEGILATVIGIATLLLGATGVVVQLKDALNTVWEVEAQAGVWNLGFPAKLYSLARRYAGPRFPASRFASADHSPIGRRKPIRSLSPGGGSADLQLSYRFRCFQPVCSR